MRLSTSLGALAAGGVLAVAAMSQTGTGFTGGFNFFATPAYAEGHDDGHDEGEHEAGGKGRGPQAGKPDGGHDEGHDEGHDDGGHDDGHESGGKGGKGGHDTEGHAGGEQEGRPSGGDGQRGGADAKGRSGDFAGRPVWAQEGIPEIELGRLNVVRSPDQVLSRAYAEALATIQNDPAMKDFYNLTLDQMVEKLSLEWDTATLIDSPLQNLALFEDVMDGSPELQALGVTNDKDTLLAVFLGVASDKNIAVETNTVIAVTAMMGMPLSPAAAAALAAEAEKIRIAVLAGHG